MAEEPTGKIVVAQMDVDEDDHAPASEVTVATYVPHIRVVAPDGRRFVVPATAKANRHTSQIVISKIRDMLDKTLDKLARDAEEKQVPVSIKTLKELTETAARLQEMSFNAYGGGKVPPASEGNSSELERIANGLVRAAAEGAVTAASDGFKDKLERIKQLGKKEKMAEPIDVTPSEK